MVTGTSKEFSAKNDESSSSSGSEVCLKIDKYYYIIIKLRKIFI